ncbi:MAG: RagB/SusD family nutrient uptake outer membrane protein [Tannerellaceae bacterium]|jgi:hypothetical protein|nr:RagB/SusD family nutrient uptake outer membrane protein [Tannerellaceae bacterium]
MKKVFIYILIGLLGCSILSSCREDVLDTMPTDAMSGNNLLANAKVALVPLNGIYRSFYTAGWSTTGNTHQCFGISAYNLVADVMGEDLIMASMGSGWFWYDVVYDVKSAYTSTAWRSYDLWNAYYTWVSNANYILAAEETMTGETEDKNYVIGQAYAIRAYAYFMLAQSFARTYKGHENEPCCPIYTKPTAAGTAGNPRSTVAQVYQRITDDINEAVKLLEKTKRQHVSHIGYDVALGIQARIALVMEDWNLALSAAEKAIEATGAKILPVESFKGVNDASAGNVMWGASIIADQSGMYAGFFTHMDHDAGYYGKSALKQINKTLYNKMGTNDGRRAWWDPNSELNKAGGYQQEKFKFRDIQTWLGDYIWMRVEEMYLTAAEAACHQGNKDDVAKGYLMQLMAMRDAGYQTNKSGNNLASLTSTETGSLLEEIITQRRIELWGEFGRIYDIRRLKQGFRRTLEMGWPEDALLGNRPTDNPESYMWVHTIPQKEFDGNENLNQTVDQNPVGDK